MKTDVFQYSSWYKNIPEIDLLTEWFLPSKRLKKAALSLVMFAGYEEIVQTYDNDSLSKAFHHCMVPVSFTR